MVSSCERVAIELTRGIADFHYRRLALISVVTANVFVLACFFRDVLAVKGIRNKFRRSSDEPPHTRSRLLLELDTRKPSLPANHDILTYHFSQI